MTLESWAYATVIAACLAFLSGLSLVAAYNWITNRYLGPFLLFGGYVLALLSVVSFFMLGFWGTR